MRRLVYYLDAVGYGGAVKYVERLVAGANPSEFAVTILYPDTAAFKQLREALAPFPVRWVDLGSQRSLKNVVYQAGIGVRRSARPLARGLHLPGVRVAAKAALGVLGLFEETRQLAIVRARLRACQPDLVHVNLDRFPDATGKLAMLVGHEAGASRVVATLHCQPQPPVFPRFMHHHFDRRSVRVVDRMIVVAQSQAHGLVRWYGAAASRVQLIPNGAASDCFTLRASRVERGQLGFEATDFLVVHMGSVLPLRGQFVLAEALDRLSGSCPHLRAAFVGDVIDPKYALSLDQRLAAHPSAPFRRLGYRPDAIEVLRLADVAVISSFEEGHSFALLEAMALGRAIVATDIPSNAESLGHGEAGLLVPPGDSWAMAAAIRRLHDDEALRTSLGAAARARAARLYTEERMVQSTLDVYRCLVRSGS